MAKTILIVEDDPNISELVQMYLEKEGYNTRIASDGGQGLDLFRQLRPDLVLLDIMLPVMDGWSVLRTIRQDSKTPVIMLTAKGETNDKVQGLKQGADDYLTKPFELPELLARIQVQLRKPQGPLSPILRVGDLEMETTSRQVKTGGIEIHLTKTEYAILKLLLQNPHQAVAKSVILDRISCDTPDCTEYSLKQHVSNLRKKLRDAGSAITIEAVWGIGFRLKEIGDCPEQS